VVAGGQPRLIRQGILCVGGVPNQAAAWLQRRDAIDQRVFHALEAADHAANCTRSLANATAASSMCCAAQACRRRARPGRHPERGARLPQARWRIQTLRRCGSERYVDDGSSAVHAALHPSGYPGCVRRDDGACPAGR